MEYCSAIKRKKIMPFAAIKDRNGMDITEAEDIKKWQEYTEELYKKIFMTQIITMV